MQASQQQLRVWTQQGDWNSASFACTIVRNGKPFTDGEYAKAFVLDVANELFDDFSDKEKIIKREKRHASVGKNCSRSYHYDAKSN